MKVVHWTSYYEFKDAGFNPFRTDKNYWEYLLVAEDGRYGFSVNKQYPTAFLGSCTDQRCNKGWHHMECVKAFKQMIDNN